ncbi:DUF982 domain-containing protein [Aquibium sp. LZ166]|uniref:DUF982 domain-containing protein n=1 Tax=Aquibium pacificus TaxID=3153579 RepID=A0ABV3SP26_9HYPH
METGWFAVPVTVAAQQPDAVQSVTNARDAAEFRLHRWPREWGRQHHAARSACLAVLKGTREPSLARAAFAAAAREADILKEDPEMAENQDLPFEDIVTVSDPVGRIEIGSARQARDYLQNAEWPSGGTQEDALNTAQAALDGLLSASDARDRFIQAARQAGVLIIE